MKKCTLVAGLVVSASVLGVLALPEIFLPKRWLDIKPGLSRSAVHSVLGTPDIVFSDKNFDGWHNPFWIGASSIVVHYDSGLSHVASYKIKTTWGFAYKEWSQQYKRHISPSPM